MTDNSSYQNIVIKCPNLFCKTKMPKMLVDAFRGRCYDCLGRNYNFIEVEVDRKCIVCSENKSCFVKLPNCNHNICISCFSNISKTASCFSKTSNSICQYCRLGS